MKNGGDHIVSADPADILPAMAMVAKQTAGRSGEKTLQSTAAWGQPHTETKEHGANA